MINRIKWCLIGIPDHQGVMNVGGRVGAARGPESFRRIFQKFKGRDGVLEALGAQSQLTELSTDVSKNHQKAADLIAAAHETHPLSVVVGGGHDHGFSQLLGIKKGFGPSFRLGCINIDAHLDVRKPSPLISSGSPFYLAVTQGVLDPKNFIEFGIQPHCNAPELWEFIETHGIEVILMKDLRHGTAAQAFEGALKRLAMRCDGIVISLDLDAAASAFAPGVSAPQAEGFSASDFLEMMAIAGANSKVLSLGIFELCPEHDPDARTARLAATSAYHFLAEALKRT
jgi:formiminoglutamase